MTVTLGFKMGYLKAYAKRCYFNVDLISVQSLVAKYEKALRPSFDFAIQFTRYSVVQSILCYVVCSILLLKSSIVLQTYMCCLKTTVLDH